MDSHQSYRGQGSRYRDRSSEPPVRRRSAYSPEPPVRNNYRYRAGDDHRKFRGSFQYRRHDGRRFSRFDSRDSPPVRSRRGRGRSSSGSRSPSPRRRHNRDRRDSIHRSGSRNEPSYGNGGYPETLGVVEQNHNLPNTPILQTQSSVEQVLSTPVFNGPSSTEGTPAYQNIPTTTLPFYAPLTAEQNHVPPAALGHYYAPPPLNINTDFRCTMPPQENKPQAKRPDEDAIRNILDKLKTKGLIDKFRKNFLDECEDMPDFIRLSERVNKTVTAFLKTRSWVPEINRNTERQLVRRRVLESSYFARELDEMLDRCFSESESYFMPAIENSVYEYLGIEKPPAEQQDKIEIEVKGGERDEENQNDDNDAADEVEEREDSEAEEESGSASSGSSYMDVDSTEGESDSEVRVPSLPRNLPAPPPAPPLGSYYPSHIPGQFGPIPSFDRISHLVPNHPPPPPLPRPLGFQGRHIPILSNTIMIRNPVENPPLPPTDDEDQDENPPLPSDEESSNQESEGENSESEEISVGGASPRVETPVHAEQPNEETQSSIHREDDEEPVSMAANPASPAPSQLKYQTPREIPLSPRVSVDTDNPKTANVLLREASESEDSPQPPPPGEEDIPLPYFPLVSSTPSLVPPVSHLQIPQLGVPPPPPLPPDEAISIPLPEDLDEEIPLPSEDPPEGSQSPHEVEWEEIPLPDDIEEDEIGAEIQLPVATTVDEEVVEEFGTIGDIAVAEDEEEPYSPYSAHSIDSPPSPLIRSNREISNPPPIEDACEIPLPTSEYMTIGGAAPSHDLSPVTSGDLDDISDESFQDIPFPPSEQLHETQEEVVTNLSEIDLPQDPLPVVSSTVELDTNMVDNNAHSKSLLDVRKSPTREVLTTGIRGMSPARVEIKGTPSANMLEVPSPRRLESPPAASSPLEVPISNPPQVSPSLSPCQLEIVEDEEAPPVEPGYINSPPLLPCPSPPPSVARVAVPVDVVEEVALEEEDEEWESPAFEKFGETSPPRIDKVEEESFENLVHTVSPQKLAKIAIQVNESEVKEKDRKSSRHRHHHSSRRRSEDGGDRKSESSRLHRKHSSKSKSRSESKDKESRKHEDRSHSKSHKSLRHSHSHSRNSSSKQKSGDDHISEAKEPKKDHRRKKRSRERSKEGKHSHSSSSSRNDSSSGKKDDNLQGVPSPGQVLPLESVSVTHDTSAGITAACVERPEVSPSIGKGNVEVANEGDSGTHPPGTLYLDGEAIEPVYFLDVIPSLDLKMRYYSKFTDPLLMDEEVSLDSSLNFN